MATVAIAATDDAGCPAWRPIASTEADHGCRHEVPKAIAASWTPESRDSDAEHVETHGSGRHELHDAPLDQHCNLPAAASDSPPSFAAMKELVPAPYKQPLLLGMLQAADEVLRAADIPYWICGGTLIGAMRHGGFVPHDDDVDIECFEADAPAIASALARASEASNLPAQFIRSSSSWEGVPMGRIVFWGAGDSHVIDVFLRESSLDRRPRFPSWHEVFPLRRYSFHGLQVSGPGGCPEGYLARCYSPDWCKSVRVWTHQAEDASGGGETWTAMCARAATLTLQDYTSAMHTAGYVAPAPCGSSARATLEHLGRDGGELQWGLWEALGWASPLPPPEGAASWEEEE